MLNLTLSPFALALALASGGPDPVCALDPVETSAPQPGARFGASTAIDGDWLLVGSPGADADRGRVEVYSRRGIEWDPAGELIPPPGTGTLGFGTSLSIDGDLAVVGSPRHAVAGADSGSVQVYRRQGAAWNQVATVVPPNAALGDRFGWSVAVRGSTLVVGAPRRFVGAIRSGSVFVFDIVGSAVNLVTELSPANGADGDAYGLSLDLEGDGLIVGAPFTDRQETDCGSAYVFERSGTWSPAGELLLDTTVPSAHLGFGVAISDSLGAVRLAFVGAPGDEDFSGTRTGTVFTFQGFNGSPWSGGFSLRLDGQQPDEEFGATIDFAPDASRAAFGAPGTPGGGRAYVYEPIGNPWLQNAAFAGSESAGRLGAAVLLDGDGLILGDPGRTGGRGVVERHGVPFNFQGGVDCDGDGTLDLCQIAAGADDLDENGELDVCQTPVGVVGCSGACPCGNDPAAGSSSGCLHSGGVGMRITGLGSASVSMDDLVLIVTDAPVQNNGIFVAGTASQAPLPLYDGLFCLSGGSLRFRPRTQTSGVVTDGDFVDQDPSGTYFSAGSTIVFQYWSRDTTSGGPSPCGLGANFSPSLAVIMMP